MASWHSALWGKLLLVGFVVFCCTPAADAQRPATDRHVPELAACLDRVEIAEPIGYRRLAVYPILLTQSLNLGGRWLSLDDALSRGVLVIREKGGGSVPVVEVENRSRDEHVFIMSGEVISGGKQTRTMRHDTIVAPGQRVDLNVYCVEQHRWTGGGEFSGSKALVPQSIQQGLRRGADQREVWAEVGRNNTGLRAENPTGSLDLALKAGPVREKLAEVRRQIVPNIPRGTVGFVFVDRGRALGAEFFGNEQLAQDLLPKLLDSYAVDCIILARGDAEPEGRFDHRPAIEFYERVCRTGSQRADTPGSGSGIRTRGAGLLGDGVSLGSTLVHFGIQVNERIIIYPPPQR